MRNSAPACAAVLMACTAIAPAAAQTPDATEAGDSAPAAPATPEEGSTVVYGRDFIEGFPNAVTVVDIIRRIPGGGQFVQRRYGGQQNGRGFSSNDDRLLINGKRISGKSNDSVSTLERITIDQVERIELIRGSSPDIKVSSQQAILNIVLRDDVGGGSGSWRLQGRWRGVARFGGFLSYGGSVGKLEYFLSGEINPEQRRGPRNETIFDGAGTVVEQSVEAIRRDRTDHDLAANLIYNFDSGSQFRLNGKFTERGFDETNPGSFLLPDLSGNLLPGGETFRINNEDRENWEVGGDFEGRLSHALGFKLLGLHSREDVFTDEREDPLVEADPAEPDEVSTQDSTAQESIARASLTWTARPGIDFEFGSELALNRLDVLTTLLERVGGVLVDQPLPDGDVTVRETRNESFVILTSKLSQRMSLESALFTEYSILKQRAPAFAQRRTFFYLRPSLDFRFDITKSDQWQVSARRTVSQLDFSNFAASVDQDNNNLFAGNRDLVPEKVWQFETSYEHRFGGDAGFVKLRLFHEDYSDKIELIEILPGVSGVGNAGDGKRNGLQLQTNLRLIPLGLRDAVIEGDVTLSDSSVTDPFTGRKRNFNGGGDREWTLRFRHDLTGAGLSYGVELNWWEGENFHDIDKVTFEQQRFFSTVFLEVQPVKGIVVRLEGRNMANNNFGRDRLLYAGGTAGGVLSGREDRDQLAKRFVLFSIRGTF